MAGGAAQRRRERRDAGGGAAALEGDERVGGRHAERDGCGGPVQLRGERAGVATADLGERAAGGQARGDGDAQQVEDVRELRLHRDPPAPRAAAEPDVGREERAGGRERAARRPEPAGQVGGERQRGQQRDERSPGLDRHHVTGRRVDTRDLQSPGEPARRPRVQPPPGARQQREREGGSERAPGALRSRPARDP